MIQISDVLSSGECEAILQTLDREDLWRDGGETAKGRARAVKNNWQADRDHSAVKSVRNKVEKSLLANEVFRAAAQPSQFARLIISKYAAGMSYGDHVDAAYIDGVRTDLSFTLFLTDADSYEGGELIVDTAGHEDAIKGISGSLVLYPSSSVHRVAPVTKGERIACIGWVKSKIASNEQRALLFELERVLADVNVINAPSEIGIRLSNIRNNLLRLFGE